jgi:hypothetical protein
MCKLGISGIDSSFSGKCISSTGVELIDLSIVTSFRALGRSFGSYLQHSN